MKTIAVLQRTTDQRMAALLVANKIRVARADLKKAIRAGDVLATSVIADPPQFAFSMKLYELLLATPKFGTVKASRLLRNLYISPSKTLGGLSARQRAEVKGYLEALGL